MASGDNVRLCDLSPFTRICEAGEGSSLSGKSFDANLDVLDGPVTGGTLFDGRHVKSPYRGDIQKGQVTL